MNDTIYDKTLLLTRVDFDKDKKPRLKLGNQQTGEIYSFNPSFDQDLTIEIDTKTRFCIGWHDLKTGEDHLCPDQAEVDKKYEQCQNCQKLTGFNPMFYNMSEADISQQQAERNAMPHFVYLAYFGEKTIKVGISFAGRGIARLLEQGARAALILGEFPSANVARSYEAKISSMADFCENVKASAKLKLLEENFNFEKAKTKLLESRAKIEQEIHVHFDQNSPLDLSEFYYQNPLPVGEIIDSENCTQEEDKLVFSGKLKAQIGYILVAEQQGELIALPIRKFTGYKVRISPKITEVCLPERQASLFDFF